MKCIVRKHAETRPGTTPVTLERHGATLVFKDVPPQVCPNRGEDSIDAAVSQALLESAEAMAAEGTQVDVRRFPAAV